MNLVTFFLIVEIIEEMEDLKLFRRLVMDVHLCQFLTQSEWLAYRSFIDTDLCLVGKNVTCIRTSCGYASIIPCFHEYGKCWYNAGFENPFGKDWLKFGVLNPCLIDRDYLGSIIQVMDEQYSWWKVDDRTNKSRVCHEFGLFLDSLRVLYEFIEDY